MRDADEHSELSSGEESFELTEAPASEQLDAPEASVELVEDGQLPGSAVTLTGPAARDLIETVAPVAREAAKAGKKLRAVRKASKAGQELYRIVPREDLAKGLKNQTLRMGTALKGGDATVLVKHAKTGRTAGHADLVKADVKAKPSLAKALGPVAWQAMAMATQQHYLVEINDKLAGVEKGVDEVLARQGDEKRSTVEELRDEATRIRTKLAQGQAVDSDALETYLHNAGRVQRELALTAGRAANNYLAGELSPEEAEDAFLLAVFAAQTLAELSGVYVGLPSDSAEQLRFRIDGEFVRLGPRREQLRTIARTLNSAHLRWQMHENIYDKKRPRHRLLQEVNKVSPKKIGGEEPLALPLSPSGAAQVGDVLRLSSGTPDALLIEVSGDEVRVAVESERRRELLPAGAELSDAQIDDAVTRYSDGRWYVHGHYGPYTTREAAVTRLRNL